VGPGDDLSLVCEEKSGSPRKAYGLDFLVAQTRVETNVSDADLLVILEAARAHLLTFRGAPHSGFEADLIESAPRVWTFHAVGLWDGAPADEYAIVVADLGEGPRAADVVEAPRSIRDVAARVLAASVERAFWQPENPSCVRVPLGEGEAVVNVVQERVVLRR
jgi:hypothetical protein